MRFTSAASGADDDDPLARALRPPPDETPAARTLRLEREAEARRVSQGIDAAIRAERQANKKKKIVRVLLLGQSESGKSTTLRQFQRLYTPSAFRAELIHWRAIIQLNLIRSIHTILAALADPAPPARRAHHASFSTASRSTHARTEYAVTSDEDADDDEPYDDYPHGHGHASPPRTVPEHAPDDADDPAALALRLLPLRHAEAFLRARLVPPSEDVPADLGARAASSSSTSSDAEVAVRSGPWRSRHCGAAVDADGADEPQQAIWRCRDEMARLWGSRRVRAVLRAKKVRLEEESGFFLDDLERVTQPHYVPTEDDVLKARLKTIGVSEYKFEMEAGPQSGCEWRIVDVGGSRFQRPTWVPFFDDVDAIIFLAPISCFDQVLAEDAKVNRLEDSVLLWKAVCSNKLLAHVDLVLFLNKCDILARKLRAGVRLAKYVRSYADRENEVEAVSKYFKNKFSAMLRSYSLAPRKFYGFCTSVTDTTTTSGILASVRDIVLRQNLRQSKLV